MTSFEGLLAAFTEPDPIPAEVRRVAAQTGIDPEALDWHVEAEHGWEPHDLGYSEAVKEAARCMIEGRSCGP